MLFWLFYLFIVLLCCCAGLKKKKQFNWVHLSSTFCGLFQKVEIKNRSFAFYSIVKVEQWVKTRSWYPEQGWLLERGSNEHLKRWHIKCARKMLNIKGVKKTGLPYSHYSAPICNYSVINLVLNNRSPMPWAHFHRSTLLWYMNSKSIPHKFWHRNSKHILAYNRSFTSVLGTFYYQQLLHIYREIEVSLPFKEQEKAPCLLTTSDMSWVIELESKICVTTWRTVMINMAGMLAYQRAPIAASHQSERRIKITPRHSHFP